jgi:hypothetical protein
LALFERRGASSERRKYFVVHDVIKSYVNRGLSIIPIETIDPSLHDPNRGKFDRNKSPTIKWEQFQKRHASLQEIAQWGEDINVGIVTGEISGVVVVDVDGDEGRVSLTRLGPIPHTPTAKSYRGHHHYFRHPGAWVTTKSGVLPGVDIRGDGGFIVASPSIHESGTQYEWEISFDEALLADLPDSIRQLVVREDQVFSSTVIFDDKDLIRAQAALPFIPADDRQTWITVGMALHDATRGSGEGYRIWEDWSRTSPGKFNERVQKRQYRSFKPNRASRVTLASVFRLARNGGWREPTQLREAPYHRLHVPRVETRMETRREVGDVTVRAMEAIKRRFRGYDHHPSEGHWDGLEQIALTIQAMANRDAALGRDLFISFVPPGIGKTTTVIETVRLLPKNVGVVIFVSRCEEIRKLVEAMGLTDKDEFSVIVSKEHADVGELGNPDKRAARVLFTTQQMLEARIEDGRLFRDVQEFYFNGEARPVRIWDEAISPSTIYTLGRYDITHLLKPCKENDPGSLADTLDNFCEALKTAKDGGIVRVPDNLGVALNEMRSWFKDESDKEACETLFELRGRECRVRRDLGGNAVLDYDDKFPEDLGPMLILDASGAHRSVYTHWHDHRGGVRFLPSPQKVYSGLTIHHWDRGSGRTSFSPRSKEWKDIVDGIARLIETIPKHEKVLVVHFKTSPSIIDLEGQLRDRVSCEKVSFLTWGKHTATNEFQDCRHVVLASVLQYSVPQTEALGRSAMKLSVGDELSQQDYLYTRLGEIAHNIFQAAGRGSVRRCTNGTCPDGCHLYVVLSSYKDTGIPRELLGDIFPGASMAAWSPVVRLTGKKQKALASSLTEAWADASTVLDKGDLIRELGLRDRYYLDRLLDDPKFVEYLKSKAITYNHDNQSVTLNRKTNIAMTEMDEPRLDLPQPLPEALRLNILQQ